MTQYPTPNPVNIDISIPSGKIEIHAEQRDTTDVKVTAEDGSTSSREAAEATQVNLDGDSLVIHYENGPARWLRRPARVRLVARVPAGGDVRIRVASADVRATGTYGDMAVTTASGDVHVDEITGDLSLRTASGDVQVGRVAGSARVNAASGDTTIGTVGGDASFDSASGDVRVDSVDGAVRATTASGDVRIGSVVAGGVGLRTASGDVAVGVASGTGVWLDLSTVSGRTSSELSKSGPPPSGGEPAVRLEIRTISGDIRVFRAPARAGVSAPVTGAGADAGGPGPDGASGNAPADQRTPQQATATDKEERA